MDNAQYTIGRLTLKPFRQLLEDGRPVPIGRKAIDLLSVLAKAEGALVTKDELMAAVWPKSIVEENVIQVHIAALRKALGKDAELLSTVHGLGYQLGVTPPVSSPGLKSEPPPDAVRRGMPSASIAVVAIAVISACALVAWLSWPTRPNGVSVAVLPFVNMSGDTGQDYFSDGMTEEITSALGKVPGLKVVGRTSAFQYKGENKDMRAIGRALGAENLIEGSVRKDGDQVRITAHLIKADDGTDLWTESYDRELKSIFSIQEDIATSIAGAMRVPLGLAQGEQLISNRTADLGAYQQYLHARALFRGRNTDEAISVLKQVVARAPNFAPAWALLASADDLPDRFTPMHNALAAGATTEAANLARSILDRTEMAARQAIRLDPRSAMGYSALASVESNHGDWIRSEDYHRRALALDPNDPDVLYGYAAFLGSVGHLQDARRIQIQLLAQEPFVPNYNRQAADVLWAMGQNDAATKMLEKINTGLGRNLNLAKVYATAGRFAQAADTILASTPSDEYPRQSLDDAARLIRSAPGKANAADTVPMLEQGLNFVYLFVGPAGRYLETAEREQQINFFGGGLFRDPWAPPSAALRKTERFKAFVRKAGFVEYWRARGWPEFCHPVGQNDFACS